MEHAGIADIIRQVAGDSGRPENPSGIAANLRCWSIAWLPTGMAIHKTEIAAISAA
jgi:hypothetical protein